MCVAVHMAPDTELTVEEVTKMHRNNADGVGIAWAKDGLVSWWKTLQVDPEYITKAINIWKAQPRLVHFRYATAGGAKVELCHPFEVSPHANYRRTGATGGQIMIHNGHWHRWDEVANFLRREGLLPEGPWSDSRLAAYMASDDPEWLASLAGSSGKVAVMNGEGKVHRIGEWKELRSGIHISNDHWQTTTVQRGGYQGFRNWRGWQWTEAEAQALWEQEQEQEAKALAELEAELAEEKKLAKEAPKSEDSKSAGSPQGADFAKNHKSPVQLGAGKAN